MQSLKLIKMSQSLVFHYQPRNHLKQLLFTSAGSGTGVCHSSGGMHCKSWEVSGSYGWVISGKSSFLLINRFCGWHCLWSVYLYFNSSDLFTCLCGNIITCYKRRKVAAILISLWCASSTYVTYILTRLSPKGFLLFVPFGAYTFTLQIQFLLRKHTTR